MTVLTLVMRVCSSCLQLALRRCARAAHDATSEVLYLPWPVCRKHTALLATATQNVAGCGLRLEQLLMWTHASGRL